MTFQVSRLPSGESRAAIMTTRGLNALTAALFVGMLVALMAVGCARSIDTAHQEAILLGVDRHWASISGAGKDVESIVAFWDDNATVFPAGAPIVRGKTAIRAFVQRSLATPGFHITWQPTQVLLSADKTLGYTSGENWLTLPGPHGKSHARGPLRYGLAA